MALSSIERSTKHNDVLKQHRPQQEQHQSRQYRHDTTRRSQQQHLHEKRQDQSDRSKAIMIHQSDFHDEKDDNDDQFSASSHDDLYGSETLYDLATWRMYYRIVEYRQQHPIPATATDIYADDDAHRDQNVYDTKYYTTTNDLNDMYYIQKQQKSSVSNASTQRCRSPKGANATAINQEYEGEVFDMEI